jgi:diguanylate cyclase (GGDEF)-like protein
LPFLVVADPLVRAIYFCLFGASALIAILAGMRIYRPARIRSWCLFAGGVALIELSPLLWVYYQLTTGAIPFPALDDAAALAGYALMSVGLLTLFRGRVPGGVHAGTIDAAILTVICAIISWIFFIHPQIHDTDLPALNTAVSMAYPLCDIALLGVAARLFLVAGERPVALRLLGLGLVGYLGADILNTILSFSATYSISPLSEAGWAAGFLAFGAFAIHPSMREIEQPIARQAQPLSINRLVVLTLVAFAAYTTLSLHTESNDLVDVVIMVLTNTLLAGLVMSRLLLLVRDLRASLGQSTTLERRLANQALHDALTGLANRRLFGEQIETALGLGSPIAVLFVDLDDFKTINDTLGHAAGDELLMRVADRIGGILRASDTPARLGGDEFGLLLVDYQSQADVINVADRVMAAIRMPISLSSGAVLITASIGVALEDAADLSTSELLRNADIAMYLAKAEGKGRAKMFQESMHAEVLAQVRALEDLTRAVEGGEIVTYYQPIVDLASGHIIGAEALSRWQHPLEGLLLPGRFIALAESSGLILPIGKATISQACSDAAAWPVSAFGAPLKIHVNLSVMQMRDADLVATVANALAASSLTPGRLVLEITESHLLDPELAIPILNDLKALRVEIAIDDFGTGYSSLSYLRRLPIDAIKVDRSFVMVLGSIAPARSLAKGIIDLAHILDLEVVAEGIEEESQRADLLGLGCTMGQGFLFARAVPVDDFRALLAAGAFVAAPIAEARALVA